jgi:hypothetical protein
MGHKTSRRNPLRCYRNFAGLLPTQDNERRKLTLVFGIRAAPDYKLLRVNSATAWFDYEIVYFTRIVTHVTYGATEAEESRTRTLHLLASVPWVYEFDSFCAYNTKIYGGISLLLLILLLLLLATYKILWAWYLSRYSDWLGAGRSGDRIPVGARFSAPVQTGPGAHPASCTMGTVPCLSRGKVRLGRAADHSPPSSVAVMEE